MSGESRNVATAQTKKRKAPLLIEPPSIAAPPLTIRLPLSIEIEIEIEIEIDVDIESYIYDIIFKDVEKTSASLQKQTRRRSAYGLQRKIDRKHGIGSRRPGSRPSLLWRRLLRRRRLRRRMLRCKPRGIRRRKELGRLNRQNHRLDRYRTWSVIDA